MAVRNVTHDLGITETERCLVECKHFFVSGKSVREADIGNFETKMKQHEANRYLLITTSTVSETVKNQLLAISKDQSSARKATYWARSDLIERLQEHPDLIKKYFHSWESEADEAVIYIHTNFSRRIVAPFCGVPVSRQYSAMTDMKIPCKGRGRTTKN